VVVIMEVALPASALLTPLEAAGRRTFVVLHMDLLTASWWPAEAVVPLRIVERTGVGPAATRRV
jgi:hypothetical protein